uniref:Uncharacterized protein n=1 Tax=Poecilia mexicana TaxID=48701 RepID=A0A3B3YLH4_9TELE
VTVSVMEEDGKKSPPPVQQIFVNDVHTYVSKHVAEVRGEQMLLISCCVFCQSPSRAELQELLLECDVVVYCVTESAAQQQIEEATWALAVLRDEMENFKTRRYFILVSTLMTWTNFRVSDPNNPVVPFLEEDFLRRRPHPKFRKHNELEKLVLKLPRGKASKLKGYVVLYFTFFCHFGENFIPMIHVRDLGRVVQGIIKVKPSSRYILAIDESKNTLEEVVKTISDVLGPEKISKLLPEDAIRMNAFKVQLPEELDCLNVNLQVEASIVSDSLTFDWTSEEGLVKNIKNIVKEYKLARQLLPIKICLIGPPAVGKTTLAMKLCQYYKLHYINVKSMFDEKITQLETIIATEEYEEEVAEEAQAAAHDQLEYIQRTLEDNEGVVTEDLIFEVLREKLYSKGSMNQGFVLDGFPETLDQANMVFSQENQDVDVLSKMPRYNKSVTPEYIFSLEAPDDFLFKRVQELPECVAEKMRYTQDEFKSRLGAYRQRCRAPVTLLDFFDHRELHPEYLGSLSDDSEYTSSMKKIIEIIGEPKNYGGTPEEQAEQKRRKEEERKQKLAAEAAERKERKAATLAEMTGHYEDWKKNLGMVVEQESEMLEAKALPLRNYLMKYVMPSLGEAMLECSKVKPEDPVDFLVLTPQPVTKLVSLLINLSFSKVCSASRRLNIFYGTAQKTE